ncbi:hypothetical protein EI94DRAFT_1709866 [Lactarius quietus]|nr:hypothetical protein EI94DRAFT_1709866 [Lactarius quietus]
MFDPSAYPLCNIPGHHPDPTPHISDASVSTTTPHAVLLDNTALVSLSSAGTPGAPSSSVPTALHVDDLENPMDVPLLDNNIQLSFNPTRQAAMESPRVPATSSDPATAVGAARDIETSAREMASTPHATSTFASSVPPMGAVSLQNTTDPLVHSEAPEILSSVSVGPVLDDITGPSLRPTSAPEPGTTQCSPKAGSREDKDTLDSPSVSRAIQANTMAILGLPPQPPPPSLPPATHVAIAGPSRRDSDVGKTEDHPPHTSHGQYDIV